MNVACLAGFLGCDLVEGGSCEPAADLVELLEFGALLRDSTGRDGAAAVFRCDESTVLGGGATALGVDGTVSAVLGGSVLWDVVLGGAALGAVSSEAVSGLKRAGAAPKGLGLGGAEEAAIDGLDGEGVAAGGPPAGGAAGGGVGGACAGGIGSVETETDLPPSPETTWKRTLQ